MQVTSNLNMSQQGKLFKQQYYRNINTLSLCRRVLLSRNGQFEHVQQWKWLKQLYYRKLNTLGSEGQCYFQVISNLNMSQQCKFFKQIYYRNINNFSLCRPVLLSGNVQSEHVATEERVQTTILSEH